MRRILAGTLCALAVGTAACASRTRAIGEDEFNPTREVAVVVKNENFYDATVYTCRRTQRNRLGVVSSNETREFIFRWVNNDLRFLIDFVGAGTYLSQAMYVETGDRLQFVITLNMNRGMGNARCL